MQKYLPIIEKINNCIAEFNSYLAPQHAIELLDTTRLDDQTYFLNPIGTDWDETPFPRNPSVGGVYFYLGISSTSTKPLMYIGKSSGTRTIGGRLFKHFRHNWDAELSYGEHKYKVEVIGAIPFENRETVFLAPALEEYLISKCDENDCILLNYQGKQ